ncbi:MAG: hypothetical protein ACFFD4_35395 [Candidatus Odinarchaeota archaeon]
MLGRHGSLVGVNIVEDGDAFKINVVILEITGKKIGTRDSRRLRRIRADVRAFLFSDAAYKRFSKTIFTLDPKELKKQLEEIDEKDLINLLKKMLELLRYEQSILDSALKSADED